MKIGVIGGAGVRTVIFINGLLKRYEKLSIDEVVPTLFTGSGNNLSTRTHTEGVNSTSVLAV